MCSYEICYQNSIECLSGQSDTVLPRDSGSQCSLLLISLINLVQTATALMERGFKTEKVVTSRYPLLVFG